MIAQGVQLEAIGRRDRLPASVARQLEESERRTSGGRKLRLRVALDYSSRQSILDAAVRAQSEDGTLTEEGIARFLGPPVDLLIRTSGEQRLSDFLLWESAYAELIFMEAMWPEFTVRELAAAVEEFHRRERRFGAVTSSRRTA